MLGGVFSGANFVVPRTSESAMKKTAGELVEMIPVEERDDRNGPRVVAWCPLCQRQFSAQARNSFSELRAAAVNSVVTHIRCVHPEN
jgi:hypothetical protein